MRLLWQLHLKMDRVLDRVSSKPNCRKKKLCVLGFSGSDLGLNVESGNGVDSGVEQNVDLGRDLALDPGPDPGTDPSTDMDSGTGLDLGSNKEIASIFKPLGPFLVSTPELLSASLSSDAGLETQGVGDSGDTSVHDRGGGSAVPELSPVSISDAGLESQGVGDLGEFFVQGRGGDSEAIDVGAGFVSAVWPFAKGSVTREESGLPLYRCADFEGLYRH
jgi:hypothetical protein